LTHSGPSQPRLDDDTVRTWYRLYEEDGFEGLVSFGYDGSVCRLNNQQQDRLKAWITETLPRTTCAVGASSACTLSLPENSASCEIVPRTPSQKQQAASTPAAALMSKAALKECVSCARNR
jgi:hypothetical protein